MHLLAAAATASSSTGLGVALAGALGAVAGAIISATVVLIAGWISRKHDRRQWTADRRLEAYAAFGAAVNACQTAYRRRELELGRYDSFNEAIQQLATARHQVLLLAPDDTGAATDAVMRAARDALGALFVPAAGRDPEAKMAEMMNASRDLLKLQQRDIAG